MVAMYFSHCLLFGFTSGFFIFKSLTEPDAPLEVDHKLNKSEKINLLHKSSNVTYKAKIDTFHSKIIPLWKKRWKA